VATTVVWYGSQPTTFQVGLPYWNNEQQSSVFLTGHASLVKPGTAGVPVTPPVASTLECTYFLMRLCYVVAIWNRWIGLSERPANGATTCSGNGNIPLTFF
jgi:hypothetical protein